METSSVVWEVQVEIGRRIFRIHNNAGEIVVGPLDAMEREDFKDALEIHFWAPFNVTFASLPYLSKSRFARIVNIASFGGKVAVPHLAPYCVSKFALVGLSDALRAELSSKNISVTTVMPNVTADLMKLTTRLLPRMPIQVDNKTYTGWESESKLSPSLLTRMADRATEFYNGLR
jgi:NAD(P)-dependent dehydrogenase (short-subunit alcohol dehydrogenase family)